MYLNVFTFLDPEEIETIIKDHEVLAIEFVLNSVYSLGLGTSGATSSTAFVGTRCDGDDSWRYWVLTSSFMHLHESFLVENALLQAEAATRLLFDTNLDNIRISDAAKALENDPRYHLFSENELTDTPLTKLAAISGLVQSRGKKYGYVLQVFID